MFSQWLQDAINSDDFSIRLQAVSGLRDLLSSNDVELRQAAQDKLEQLSLEDPEIIVRSAAKSSLDEHSLQLKELLFGRVSKSKESFRVKLAFFIASAFLFGLLLSKFYDQISSSKIETTPTIAASTIPTPIATLKPDLILNYELLGKMSANTLDDISASPDQAFIAVASGNEIFVYEAQRFSTIRTFKLNDRIRRVEWSPNGLFIATSAGIVDAQTGTVLRDFDLSDDFSWSPDSEYLAVSNYDKIEIIELRTGRVLHSYVGQDETIANPRWSPDGRYLAANTRYYFEKNQIQIYVFDTLTGGTVQVIGFDEESHTGVWGFEWSPDGKYLAFSNDSVQLLDTTTWSYQKPLGCSNEYFMTLQWSSDSKKIAAGGADNTVCVWDVQSGERTLFLEDFFENIFDLAWVSGNNILITASNDGSVKSWNVKNGALVNSLDYLAKGDMYLSPDATQLAILGEFSFSVQVWDVSSSRQSYRITIENQGSSYYRAKWLPIDCVAWAPNGKVIALASLEEVYFFDGSTGRPLFSIPIPDPQTRFLDANCLTWQPDGQLVAVAVGTDIQLINFADEVAGATLDNKENVAKISWSPDGNVLAAGSSDGVVRLWNIKDDREQAAFRGHGGEYSEIMWDIEQNQLFVVTAEEKYNDRIKGESSGYMLRVWDLKGDNAISEPMSTVYLGREESVVWLIEKGETEPSELHVSISQPVDLETDEKLPYLMIYSNYDLSIVKLSNNPILLSRDEYGYPYVVRVTPN